MVILLYIVYTSFGFLASFFTINLLNVCNLYTINLEWSYFTNILEISHYHSNEKLHEFIFKLTSLYLRTTEAALPEGTPRRAS